MLQRAEMPKFVAHALFCKVDGDGDRYRPALWPKRCHWQSAIVARSVLVDVSRYDGAVMIQEKV